MDVWISHPVGPSRSFEWSSTSPECIHIVTTPLVLKDQDLKVHLMSSKEEKIAAVQLVENQKGKPLGTPKKNSFESQSIGEQFGVGLFQ